MVLLNLAMIFLVLDAKVATLPSTISCHVNLMCSHLELLTSKHDDQIIWKHNVLPDNPPEAFGIDILEG